MSSVSPTNQDLSNDTTFSQIKSRVPVPLKGQFYLHVGPDEGEDKAPVHDREQVVQEEGQAGVQLLHLLGLLNNQSILFS